MARNRKIVITRLGESFRDCTRIEECALPEPGPGEVRVRHHYAGVNGVYDQMMCLDRVEHTPVTPPADTGVETVGVVDAVGEGVTTHAVGEPVAVVRAGYGYRLWQVCPAPAALPVPVVEPWVLALVPSGVSALLALERVGEMGTGEIVCISAAAGGLGNVATQLAVEAGNRVVAVCGSTEKAGWLRALGCERVVNRREEALGEVLAAEYGDAIDLALDSVGGETFDAMVDNLAPHGRLVVCGYTSDRLPTERVTDERIYTRLYWKAASVRGFMNYRFGEFAAEARARLFDGVSRGRLQPAVDQRAFRGLEAVPDAVEHLLGGGNLGKVVVDLR